MEKRGATAPVTDKGPAGAITTVSAYLAEQPPASRRVLRLVRKAIRDALPRAEESISYRIPTYKLHGTPVIYFAGWARHYSLYPVTPAVLSAFGTELQDYYISKGTIRFPIDQPVPVDLVARIATVRAHEVATAPSRKKR